MPAYTSGNFVHREVVRVDFEMSYAAVEGSPPLENVDDFVRKALHTGQGWALIVTTNPVDDQFRGCLEPDNGSRRLEFFDVRLPFNDTASAIDDLAITRGERLDDFFFQVAESWPAPLFNNFWDTLAGRPNNFRIEANWG